jgi:hypothetical protein
MRRETARAAKAWHAAPFSRESLEVEMALGTAARAACSSFRGCGSTVAALAYRSDIEKQEKTPRYPGQRKLSPLRNRFGRFVVTFTHISVTLVSLNDSTFSVVPEAGLTLGWNLNSQVKVTLGYTFIYWSEVARPGNQIDRNRNPSLIPTDPAFGNGLGGGARPAFNRFQENGYWAQGINFGVEFKF